MTRQQAGFLLKSLLQHHLTAETEALAALPEEAPYDQHAAAIAAVSHFEYGGLIVEIRRRRSLIFCPVPACRYAKMRAACDFSNTRYTIADPKSGLSASGHGLLWHLLAEHGPLPAYADEEEALIAVLARSTS